MKTVWENMEITKRGSQHNHNLEKKTELHQGFDTLVNCHQFKEQLSICRQVYHNLLSWVVELVVLLYGDRRYQKHDNCSEESIKGNYECNQWIGSIGLSWYFDDWVMGMLIFGKPVVFGWETDLMLICNCEGNPNHTFFSLFIFFLFVTRCAGWGWKETRELGRELVGAQAEARLVTQWTPFNIFVIVAMVSMFMFLSKRVFPISIFSFGFPYKNYL